MVMGIFPNRGLAKWLPVNRRPGRLSAGGLSGFALGIAGQEAVFEDAPDLGREAGLEKFLGSLVHRGDELAGVDGECV